MARSAWFAAELSRNVPAIPSLVWRNERDLDRWAAWLLETGPEAVAVDLGTARAASSWSWALGGIAYLAERVAIGSGLRLVVNGPSTVDRLLAVREAWNSDLTFASQNPWHLAQGGKRLLATLSDTSDDRPRAELEDLNRETFERVAKRIVGNRSAHA
jgi:hypothetical protein